MIPPWELVTSSGNNPRAPEPSSHTHFGKRKTATKSAELFDTVTVLSLSDDNNFKHFQTNVQGRHTFLLAALLSSPTALATLLGLSSLHRPANTLHENWLSRSMRMRAQNFSFGHTHHPFNNHLVNAPFVDALDRYQIGSATTLLPSLTRLTFAITHATDLIQRQ